MIKYIKNILIISILAVMLVIPFSINNISMAGVTGEAGSIAITPKDESGAGTKIGKAAGGLLGVLQIIGYAAAVIVLVWLGIKYIVAAPDGKAEIKKQAFAYILGAVLLFSAGTIVGIIKGFTSL